MTSKTPRARFWVLVNGAPVRITLCHGQALSHVEGGSTDEGWSYTASQWRHDGPRVVYSYSVRAQDCDGRIDRHGELDCSLSSLAAGYHEAESGATYPAWQEISHGQRDYSAERAGY